MCSGVLPSFFSFGLGLGRPLTGPPSSPASFPSPPNRDRRSLRILNNQLYLCHFTNWHHFASGRHQTPPCFPTSLSGTIGCGLPLALKQGKSQEREKSEAPPSQTQRRLFAEQFAVCRLFTSSALSLCFKIKAFAWLKLNAPPSDIISWSKLTTLPWNISEELE